MAWNIPGKNNDGDGNRPGNGGDRRRGPWKPRGGGGPFDADPRIQGFASGLFTDPNGAPVNGTPEQQQARLLLHHDQIKVGLAGNLRDYTFVDRTGATVTGADVDYNGSPASYAADPEETITYVDAHDNEHGAPWRGQEVQPAAVSRCRQRGVNRRWTGKSISLRLLGRSRRWRAGSKADELDEFAVGFAHREMTDMCVISDRIRPALVTGESRPVTGVAVDPQ